MFREMRRLYCRYFKHYYLQLYKNPRKTMKNDCNCISYQAVKALSSKMPECVCQ